MNPEFRILRRRIPDKVNMIGRVTEIGIITGQEPAHREILQYKDANGRWVDVPIVIAYEIPPKNV